MPRIAIEELKKDIIVDAHLKGQHLSFHTTWGLFSPEKIDEGTAMLLGHIHPDETADILDLGCGYGPIGITLAKLAPKGSVDMVDKDFVAVEYANKNVMHNDLTNAHAFLSNGFDQIDPHKKYDLIISNLPAKISKEFFWILFAEAHDHLKPGGKFVVVTIAGLSYFIEKNFKTIFGNYKLLESKNTYFVAEAVK